MKILLAVLLLFVAAVAAMSQVPLNANPAEQARIKPLLENLKKAQEPYTAKRDTLPEAKAVKDARAALETAQFNLTKALEAQNKAAALLPEFDPVKVAEARLLDEIYRILADHKLSSREYQPTFNDKGELAFSRIEPPKP